MSTTNTVHFRGEGGGVNVNRKDQTGFMTLNNLIRYTILKATPIGFIIILGLCHI